MAIDSSGSTIYVVTGSHSIFKTADRGSTWRTLGAISGVYAVAIDPASPSTLYAATRHGIRKSTDGGESWTAAGLTDKSISVLAVDPMTSSTVYAAVGKMVYKTTDGALTWSALDLAVFESWIGMIVLDPSNPSTVYVAGSPSRLYKSTDAGATWSTVNDGFFASWLRVAPWTPTVLFAIRAQTGFSRSTDGGVTWTSIAPGLPVQQLAIDPSNPGTLYAALTGPNLTGQAIYKSTDNGDSWFLANTSMPVAVGLTVDPADPSVVYAVSYKGALFRSTDAGRNWNDRSPGLRVFDLNLLSVDLADPGTIYAGGASGLFKSLDRGANWNPVAAFQVGMGFPPPGLPPPATPLPSAGPAALSSLLINPAHAIILYAGTHRPDGCFYADQNFYKSVDGGATWSNSTSPQWSGCTSDGSLIMDPADPNTIYMPMGDIFDGYWVMKSSDGGTTWGYANLDKYLYSLVFDPRNTAILYAATDAGAVHSRDGGATWSAPQLADANPTILAIDPQHPDVLYAAGAHGLFKSIDHGDSWSPVGRGLTDALAASSLTALLIDPAQTDVLYLATSAYGVIKSSDGGSTWALFNDGLPNVDVRAMALLRNGATTLVAATPGGIFKLLEDGQ